MRNIPTSAGKAADGSFSKADIRYKAIEYTLQINMRDGSWASFAEAEQIARDHTWDPNQVESADLLFQNPPDKMVGQKRWNNVDVDNQKINLKVFQPKKTDNLFVLSGSANLSKKASETLLQPGKLIEIGERVGKRAAIIASEAPLPINPKIDGIQQENPETGNVGELLEGLRPSLNLGEVMAEETSLPVLATYDVVVIALETVTSHDGAITLYNLLMLPGVTDHSMPDIQTAKKMTPLGKTDTTTRNNSLRELILGRALYKCGDYNGLGNKILQAYSKDLRGHYYRHASGVLEIF